MVTSRLNVLHDERTEAGPFHRFAYRKGALGNLDGFVEHQDDFLLRHGWVEFAGDGAYQFFLVYESVP